MRQALRLCPQLIILPPRFRLYHDYSRRVMAILHEVCPLVEQISIDEAYLDLSARLDAWEEVVEIARHLQQRVLDQVGLSAALGVATNKLLAKIASEQDKPAGLTVVRPGAEAAFLAPLPLRALWGVGPATARKLAEMGVTTIGELAAVPEAELRARFGQHGRQMARQSRGIDERPVTTAHERKSLSQERTFARDLMDAQAMRRHLWRMSQDVAQQLQKEGLAAGTIAIKLRYADFQTFTRQMRLAKPTDDERTIYRAAQVLLKQTWDRQTAVRLLGVTARQLSLPEPTGQLPLL